MNLKGLLKKYNNLSLPVKAVFWFTICNFILKGISFITVPIFTRMLSTSEYGVASLYYSYEQIFIILATFELSLGAYQRGVLKFKEDIPLFTQSMQLLSTSLTMIFLVIFLLFSDQIVKLTGIPFNVFSVMFGYLILQPAYNAWLTRKRFYYEYKQSVIVTVLFAILTVGASMAAVTFIESTAYMKVTSMLWMEILFCLPFYLKNINVRNIIKNKEEVIFYWKYLLRFQIPLVFHSLSYLVLGQADRIMIGSMVGTSETAIYSVAYSLASVLSIFQVSINQSFKPWRYQKLEDKNYSDVKNVSNVLLIFMGVVVLAFILVAPEVMKLLFNPEYYDAIWIIPSVTLSVYFMFLYNIFTDIESYYGETRYIAVVSVICALVNIVLNYFAIEIFGYIACGYTTLFSYILFSMLHYFFMNKVCKENIGLEQPVDRKFILIFSMILLVSTIVITLLYNYNLIRLLLLLILLVILVIKRKVFIQLVKNIKKP
ncbi:lipopolysaccharide biosynthesis protein [Breznakia pachnodae]|uniref:O-antigen/teichoic acid export membrane protein n=1 Tax=Breznakia pachnodae TaxID=265178 RepID=A0ABU0DZD5_9FIRM|nr:oligosaccharide flippase family protein [Breznakia pachnodae]MDQ0359811.1 O-antigen/teichoic acid export membrane protein [Breznakia pachnodae]